MKVLPSKGEGLSVVGFRISLLGEHPDLYTIVVYNGKDSPITIDGKIAFVTKPEHAIKLYQLCNKRLKALGPPSTEVALICDVPETLKLIRQKNRDSKAVILNSLNTIFDLLGAVKVEMPSEYKSVLYKMADHLTFNREYAGFIQEQGLDRELMINAVTWCVGAIALSARVEF